MATTCESNRFWDWKNKTHTNSTFENKQIKKSQVIEREIYELWNLRSFEGEKVFRNLMIIRPERIMKVDDSSASISSFNMLTQKCQ